MNLYTILSEGNNCIIEPNNNVIISDHSQEIRIIGEMNRQFRCDDNLIASIVFDIRNKNYIIKDDNIHISRQNQYFNIITTKNEENIYIPSEKKDSISVYEVLEVKEENIHYYTYIFSIVVRQSQLGVPAFENFIPIWIGNLKQLNGKYIYYYENGSIRFKKTNEEVTKDDSLLDIKKYVPLNRIEKKKMKV